MQVLTRSTQFGVLYLGTLIIDRVYCLTEIDAMASFNTTHPWMFRLEMIFEIDHSNRQTQTTWVFEEDSRLRHIVAPSFDICGANCAATTLARVQVVAVKKRKPLQFVCLTLN